MSPADRMAALTHASRRGVTLSVPRLPGPQEQATKRGHLGASGLASWWEGPGGPGRAGQWSQQYVSAWGRACVPYVRSVPHTPCSDAGTRKPTFPGCTAGGRGPWRAQGCKAHMPDCTPRVRKGVLCSRGTPPDPEEPNARGRGHGCGCVAPQARRGLHLAAGAPSAAHGGRKGDRTAGPDRTGT